MLPRKTIYIGTTLEDNPVSDHFSKLGEALADRGYQVLLLTPHRKHELENPDGNPAIFTWPSDRPTHWHDARFLRQLSSHRRPDCFIAHFAAVNIMCLVGWALHVPNRVVWYHTMRRQLDQDHPKPPWKRVMLNARKRLVYSMATHIIANSHASARDVQTGYGVPAHKCRVFYNSLADPLQDRRVADLSSKPGQIICVARLFPSKGQDVLLKAVAILKQRHVLAQLELVGIGPWEERYRALAKSLGIADQCTFRGRLSHLEVLQHMREATAVASPSRSEALGNVNIEAIGVGTPVIGSAVDGIREVVRDGQDGALVPPDDPPRLADALQRVLGNEALRERLGSEARQRFLSTFEQRRIIARQLQWQESLLRN